MGDVDEEPDIAYWRPRMMSHGRPDGRLEYAVHEVYFATDGSVAGFTDAAVSPRCLSTGELHDWIKAQLAAPDDGVSCGDLGYIHGHGAFRLWLTHIDEGPVLDAQALAGQ
jgi:hypothetical protein